METNEQRLRRFVAARDEAIEHKDRMVALLAAEIERQKIETRTASPGKYTTNYAVSQAPKKVVAAHRITPRLTAEQVRAEQQKVREQFFREQELQSQLRSVMAGWQDPQDYQPDSRVNFGNR
jgi:hypothetical protein